jgi:hypothetical protein
MEIISAGERFSMDTAPELGSLRAEVKDHREGSTTVGRVPTDFP